MAAFLRDLRETKAISSGLTISSTEVIESGVGGIFVVNDDDDDDDDVVVVVVAVVVAGVVGASVDDDGSGNC